MRKVISIILLLILIIPLLAACGKIEEHPSDTIDTPIKTQWAVLRMPDDSIVEGMCEYTRRYTSGYVEVMINGTMFYCDRLRLVVFDVEN